MKNLTLIIPAKEEAESLPQVLKEIKNFDCKIIIILESSDIETIKSISNWWIPPWVLVFTTRFDLCLCHFNIFIHIPNE